MSDRLRDVTTGEAKRSGIGGWFAGRANRKEYWLWAVPILLIGIVVSAFLPLAAYAMSLFITFIWIRRFHDFGRTGWWVAAMNIAINVVSFGAMAALSPEAAGLLAFAVYLGAVVVMGAIPGQPHPNEFGPAKGRADLKDTFS